MTTKADPPGFPRLPQPLPDAKNGNNQKKTDFRKDFGKPGSAASARRAP